MKEFERDMNRYIVIKRSDLQAVPNIALSALDMLLARVNTYRALRGKQPLQTVVVESDWPEYERVWAMIEERVTGKSEALTLGERAHQYAEKLVTLRTYPVLEKGAAGSHEFAHRNAAVNECAAILLKHGFVVNFMERGGPNITHIGPTLKMLGLDGSDVQHSSTNRQTEFYAQLMSGMRPDQGYRDALEEYPLPHWAIARSNGSLQVGLQLATKDGRRCGNGHIVGTEDGFGGITYAVLTDAGNRLRLLEAEVDELFHRGEYISALDEILAKFDRDQPVIPAILARPSGHGPVAWFLAAVDDARQQGHENMMLERGLGNLIAEHISKLEDQVERYQRIEQTTAINIDLSGITDADRAALMAQADLYRNQHGVITPAPRPAPRTGNAKKSLPLGARGTNYHLASAMWMDDGKWIEIRMSPLVTTEIREEHAKQAGKLAAILANHHPGTEVVVALESNGQERYRSTIVGEILESDSVQIKDAAHDWSRVKVVHIPPKEGE